MKEQLRAVLVNDTAESGHLGCRIVVDQIVRLAARAGIAIIATCKTGESLDAIMAKVEGGQVCLVNGEGTLHHSSKNGLTLARVATACKARGIPCYLINSVYQENDDTILRHVKDFDGVYVRERLSREVLLRQGVAATVVPDLVLSTDLPQQPAAARRGYLFSDSVNRSKTRALYEVCRSAPFKGDFQPMEPLHDRPREGRLVRNLFSRLAHHGKASAFRMGSGLPLLRALPYVALRGALYRPVELADFLSRLSRCGLFVTGRFHGVCLAMLTETPFVAISSNTHKTEGLLLDSGLERRVLRDAGQLRQVRAEEFLFTPEELEKLRTFIDHARTSAEAMFAAIRAGIAPV